MISTTYYYIQAQEKGKEPKIIPHSIDEETGERHYKFITKSKATDLLKKCKERDTKTKFRIVKLVETYKFRIVKLVETYTVGEWV